MTDSFWLITAKRLSQLEPSLYSAKTLGNLRAVASYLSKFKK